MRKWSTLKKSFAQQEGSSSNPKSLRKSKEAINFSRGSFPAEGKKRFSLWTPIPTRVLAKEDAQKLAFSEDDFSCKSSREGLHNYFPLLTPRNLFYHLGMLWVLGLGAGAFRRGIDSIIGLLFGFIFIRSSQPSLLVVCLLVPSQEEGPNFQKSS